MSAPPLIKTQPKRTRFSQSPKRKIKKSSETSPKTPTHLSRRSGTRSIRENVVADPRQWERESWKRILEWKLRSRPTSAH